MQLSIFLEGILYNTDVFLEYFFDALDNFSFEVHTKLEISWKT